MSTIDPDSAEGQQISAYFALMKHPIFDKVRYREPGTMVRRLLDELDRLAAAVVIDRNDLPEAGYDDQIEALWSLHPDADGTWWNPSKVPPALMRGRALEILALVEHHTTTPTPPEEKTATELAAVLQDAAVRGDWHEHARQLVAAGWKRDTNNKEQS